MKKISLFAILLLATLNLKAQTEVAGNQSGVWRLSGSPYQVIGQITVPTGQTLRIEAGVEINFQGYYKFNVNGKLLVNGVANNMVLFTSNNTNTGWGGIRFDQVNEISKFKYCKFEYGKTSSSGVYPDIHGGAVMLKESNAEFYNCIFSNNDASGSGDDGMGGAVYAFNTGTTDQTLTKFIDCEFINNHAATEGGAIKFTNDGNTEITRCIFRGNTCNFGGGAIMFYSALNVHITNCLFYENTSSNSGGGAIKTLNPTVILFFTNCTFYNNSANGSGEGGAADLSYTNATFTNTIIYNNHQQFGKDINVGIGATATINYCNVDMPDFANGNNNLNSVNPLFVNTNTGDFHLQANSPCIDTGTDVGLPFAGNNPDMGCYEFDATAAIEDQEYDVFTYYPNPVHDNLTIKSHTKIRSIQISNLLGKIVLKKTVNAFEPTINISQLNDGVYLSKILFDSNNFGVSKIIISH